MTMPMLPGPDKDRTILRHMTTCSVDACEREAEKRSMCNMHYRRWRRWGDPTLVRAYWTRGEGRKKKLYRTVPIWTRLMSAREISPSGCWLYTGAVDGSGYGSVAYYGKPIKTHRWMYQTVIGDIPEGYQVDHLCKVRRCFNPWHLEAVTPRENVRRSDSLSGQRSRQTHCKRGHPFSPENTYVDKQGRRVCRTCKAAYFRQRRANAARA